jgi:DNA invertase Pin-like site-specific DNA recombinase
MQTDILKTLCERAKYELVEIIEDKAVSGGVLGRDRKGMSKLLKMVNKREIDVVLVYSVDRIGRKLSDVISIAENFAEKGVGLVIHKNGIDTTTSMGRHLLNFFALVAEMEKDFITSRVRDGMALAKKKGKQIGGKKLSSLITKQILSLRSQGKGINLIAKTLGVGNGSVARVIKEEEKMVA